MSTQTETFEVRPRIASLAGASACSREELITFFHRLFANCKDVMNLFSLREGKVLAQNAASFHVTGYTPEDYKSRPIESFYPPEELPKVAAAFAKMAESGFVAENVRMYYKDGEVRDLWVRSYIIQREPEPICLVHTIDITEAQRKQEKAIQEAKLASLGEFAAALAHELGNSIQSLDHNASFLTEHSFALEPEIAEKLTKVRQLSEHMTRVLRNMQRFANVRQDLPKGYVSVPAALHGALEIVGPYLKRHHVTLEVKSAKNTPPIVGVVSQFQQIFVILLRNAVQAMLDQPDRRMSVELSERESHVVVSIKDTGAGIPPELQTRLFESFMTTKDDGEGLGLGLSIAKRLADANGVGIDVTSDHAAGTTFHLTFPLSARAKTKDDAQTVLIMDDGSASLQETAESLVAEDLLVFTASTASEAMDILAHHRVSAVLAEIDAYPVSGVAFARSARAYHDGPIIWMGEFDGLGPSSLPPGLADAVLPKPIDPKSFISLIKRPAKQTKRLLEEEV